MSDEIIVAVLALCGTLIGTFGGILVSSKLTNYRLEQLENRVGEHNNFAARMPIVEQEIKRINRRLEELEGLHKREG